MAAIDIICLDKTGTLTTNKLRVERFEPLDELLSEEELRQRLRLFVSASVDRDNKNLQAISAALGSTSVELLEQIPFKAQNCYTRGACPCGGRGARACPWSRRDSLRAGPSVGGAKPGAFRAGKVRALTGTLEPRGLRLLLLAESGDLQTLAGQTALADVPLRPLILVSLIDELRPDVMQVLEALSGQGIAFKILSGDNPETVKGTLRQISFGRADEPVVSGTQLAEAADQAALIKARGVFGRRAAGAKSPDY